MLRDARKAVLDEAYSAVCVNRQDPAADVEDSFALVASLATAALGRTFTASDVTLFLCCVKLARLSESSTHRDSWVDLAGYAVCGGATCD